MKIERVKLSYGDIRNNVKLDYDDRFGLAGGLTEVRKKTFLANPNQHDDSKCLLNLKIVDGIIAGRSMLYETKVKLDDTIIAAQSASTLDVPEQYRNLVLGAELLYDTSSTPGFDGAICSGISDIALPLYKALKFYILEFPRMMLVRNTRSLLEYKGLKGRNLELFSFIANIPVKFFNWFTKSIIKLRYYHYEVRKEKRIPNWVEDVVLNDGHKYMEVHNLAWLQWNLDYNFKGDKQDIQTFYSVYKDGKPLGFFMTKERFRKDAGGLKNIILAAIVEWGVRPDSGIDEAIINKLALLTFTPNVDIIEFATNNIAVCKTMMRYGFIKHGYAHIAFKDRTKKYKDSSDINLWRIRYGYADVILT